MQTRVRKAFLRKVRLDADGDSGALSTSQPILSSISMMMEAVVARYSVISSRILRLPLFRVMVTMLLHHYPLAGIYYLLAMIKGEVIMTNGTSEEIKMRLIAIKDAVFSRLGKHPVYQP